MSSAGFEMEEFISTWTGRATALTGRGYKITPVPGSFAIPLTLDSGKRKLPGVAALYNVGEPGKPHLVVLGYSPFTKTFMLWCGDSYLEGGRRADADVESLLRVEFDAQDADFKAAGGDASAAMTGFMSMVSANKGTQPESSPCNFWRSGMTCKHTKGLIHQLMKDGSLRQELERLQTAAETIGLVPGVAATTSSNDPLTDKLDRYAFTKHVLMEGDKGSGKTVGAEAYARKHGIDPLFIVGHEGMESTDLLGHFVRMADGSMAWKDGKLTEAFRRAESCDKTILILDEMLRIPQRHLSVLVGALSPSSEGCYRLNTGRPLAAVDGVIREEVLTCHKSMLWVVATTNIGAGYAVDQIDSALSDRFRRVRVDTTKEKIQTVLKSIVDERSFSPAWVDRLVAFWEAMTSAKVQGELTQIVNLRHLCEALTFATSERAIRAYLDDLILTWVDRDTDGHPIKAQIDFVTKALDKTVPAATGGKK